jgi:hypothetical protein
MIDVTYGKMDRGLRALPLSVQVPHATCFPMFAHPRPRKLGPHLYQNSTCQLVA